MESYLVWLVCGLALIIAELATGTFYLVVLGIAALVGSAVGWSGGGFSAQAIAASAIAVIGVVVVNRWRRSQKRARHGGNNIDIGQAVVFEAWVNESARLARVKYRGTSWDAILTGNDSVKANDMLYICGSDGSRLQVSPAKPS